MRGGIRCFPNALDQDRSEIDHDDFKKHIADRKQYVQSAEKQDRTVYLEKIFSASPLYQPERRKKRHDPKQKDTHDIADRIPKLARSERFMYRRIEMHEAHLGTCRIKARNANVHRLYQDRENDKKQKKYCRDDKRCFCFFHFCNSLFCREAENFTFEQKKTFSR